MTDRKLNLTPKTAACPTCKTPVEESAPTFPFCNDRCKQIDLGRWFNEDYKVTRPIEQADIEEDD